MSAMISQRNLKSQKILTGQVAGDGNDIISTLPDSVLLYILSFLPIKDVLRTSALSTRWKNLSTCISDIDFDEFHCLPWKTLCDMRTSFLYSVERMLLNDSSAIRKFHLKLCRDLSASHLKSWVFAAISRKVQELDLSLPQNTLFVLPASLFTCESLRTLKLYLPFEVPSLVHFSNLKILSLHVTGDQLAEHLFSGCPVLEELSLCVSSWESDKKITISLPTLRKLSICCGAEEECELVITIYAENLLSLKCMNCRAIELILYNLVSLITAYIDEPIWEMKPYAERTVKLFRGIRNVKSLAMSEATLECLSAEIDMQACLPTFHRLTHFKLEAGHNFANSEGLVCFLHKSPNLESLGISTVCFQSHDCLVKVMPRLNIVPQRFSTCLKTVAIATEMEDKEIHFLKYLLENAKVLERIKISCTQSRTNFVKREINSLLKANRLGSPGCRIEFCKIDDLKDDFSPASFES